MASNCKKRNNLACACKHQVIKAAEKDKKLGVCGLAKLFDDGKTQISVILKNKDQIEELYAANASGQRCQISKRF